MRGSYECSGREKKQGESKFSYSLSLVIKFPQRSILLFIIQNFNYSLIYKYVTEKRYTDLLIFLTLFKNH